MCVKKSNHLIKKKKKKIEHCLFCTISFNRKFVFSFYVIFKQITPSTLFPFSRKRSTIRICNESFSIDATKFKYDYAHFVTLFQKRRFIVYVYVKTERYEGRGYPKIFSFLQIFSIYRKRENRND